MTRHRHGGQHLCLVFAIGIAACLASPRGASAFEYHDNKFSFEMARSYHLRGGSFTITDFYVRHAQDPDENIKAGLELPIRKNNLTFRIGRHGDDKTADWFNRRIGKKRNTFGHDAGKLNFALIGTLKLRVSGGHLGRGESTYVFHDIALAQGKSGGRNNWWFGGKNCEYIGKHWVECTGHDFEKEIKVRFRRGGSKGTYVNRVRVDPMGTERWMSFLDDETRLDELTMPGSHDAGVNMEALPHCTDGAGALVFVRAQSGSIYDQMRWGSRFFDIRVDYNHGKLVTYHRNDSGRGCNGEDLKDVFDEAIRYVTHNPTETAILKISHIRADEKKQGTIKDKLLKFIDKYVPSGRIFKILSDQTNLACQPLKELRGKVVLVFDTGDSDVQWENYRLRMAGGRDGTCPALDAQKHPQINLLLTSEWADTAKYEEMYREITSFWKENAGIGKGYFMELQWILTGKAGTGGIRMVAAKANKHIDSVLNDKINNEHWPRPNVVLIDFIRENDSGTDIVQFNPYSRLRFLLARDGRCRGLTALKPGETVSKPWVSGWTCDDWGYELDFQDDGNLVLYFKLPGTQPRFIWNTGTTGSGDKLTMRSDGNLVVTASNGHIVWESETENDPGAELSVLPQGDLVLVSTGAEKAVWSSRSIYNPKPLARVLINAHKQQCARYGSLASGMVVKRGEDWHTDWTCGNWGYSLGFQNDGNLELHFKPPSGPSRRVWDAKTKGRGDELAMQEDGNLVIYSAKPRVPWSSKTAGHPGARLSVQPDGNVLLHDASGKVVWTFGGQDTPVAGAADLVAAHPDQCTHYGSLEPGTEVTTETSWWSGWTCGDWGYNLGFQTDGNFVLYFKKPTVSRFVVWSSKSQGAGRMLAMQNDGNLVLRGDGGRVIWNSRTQGHPGVRLSVQPDGNVLLHDASGNIVWRYDGPVTPVAGAADLVAAHPDQCTHYGSLEPGTEVTTETGWWSGWTCGDWGYNLGFQTDGNLVLYFKRNTPDIARVWGTDTADIGRTLAMQHDGNLVLYGDIERAPIWATRTQGYWGAHLSVQPDGNVLISAKEVLWSTQTAFRTRAE